MARQRTAYFRGFLASMVVVGCGTPARPPALDTQDADIPDVGPMTAPDGGGLEAGTDTGTATDTGGITATDGGTGPWDADPGDGGYLPGPYGTTVGAVFEPFQVPTCDGVTYAFAGPDLATARFTVVSLVALWNTACQTDAMAFQTVLAQTYRTRGVRVLQVLAEGIASGTASPTECFEWRARNGLSFPVLLDPMGTVQRTYAPDHVYPRLLIVDAHGRIRWISEASPHGTADVRAELETLLAGP